MIFNSLGYQKESLFDELYYLNKFQLFKVFEDLSFLQIMKMGFDLLWDWHFHYFNVLLLVHQHLQNLPIMYSDIFWFDCIALRWETSTAILFVKILNSKENFRYGIFFGVATCSCLKIIILVRFGKSLLITFSQFKIRFCQSFLIHL